MKSELQGPEKDSIAEAAVALVMPGTAIGISAGTTTYALARRLVDVPGLTVVTNSVPVADVLHRAGRSDQTIILTGGVRTPSDALVGPFAVAALRTIHLDQVFMGVHGISEDAGFTTPNILESETNEALEVIRGKVLYHAKDRDEVYRQAVALRPKRSAILYTGQIPEDTAIGL